MSDVSDVLNVVATIAADTLYPNGSDAASITGTDIVVLPGWPSSSDLDKALAIGKSQVTVFPKGDDRNTTRYPEKWHVTTQPTTSIDLTIAPSGGRLLKEDDSGLLKEDGSALLLEYDRQKVTISGTIVSPQNVMLRVNAKVYIYAVLPNDTLASIATALGAQVALDIPDTVISGATITVGPTGRIQAARAGGFGTVTREVRRQERIVMITVWAPTPELRDRIAAAVDVALSSRRFINMPDGFGARIIYKSSLQVDALQKATLYRRDLNYTIEFATTVSEQAAAVIATKTNIETNGFTN